MVDKAKLLFIGIIVVVIALIALPIVIKATNDANSISGISNYAGTTAGIGLIPLLFVVGAVVSVVVGIFFTKWG